LKQVFTEPSVVLKAHGTATAWLGHCLMGDGLFVQGLPVRAEVLVSPALNNVPGSILLDFDTVDGRAHPGLTTTFMVSVPNPTVLSVRTPLIPVKLYKHGVAIGTAKVVHPVLPAKSNSSVHTVGILPSGVAEVPTVIATYLEGQSQSVTVVGDPDNDELKVTLLKPSLAALKNDFGMPGYAGKLIAFAKMSFDILLLADQQIPVSILCTNPWSVPFTIQKVQTQVFVWDGRNYDTWIGEIGPLDPKTSREVENPTMHRRP